MAYVICEKCGGYYELSEGESVDDFDTCQCGGDLSYTEKLHQKKEKNDKPKLICSNCMKENEDGIFCSKCGGKLITVKRGKAVNDIKTFEESKELEKLSHKASKKDKAANNDYKRPKDLLTRINWLGVFVGVGFLVVSLFISALILVFSLISGDPYVYPDYSSFAFKFIIFILLSFILAIVAGGLAVFIGKSRDYENGIINGFLVGLISSVILGIFSGLSAIFIGVIIHGTLTAFGGAIGIFVKKQLDK